MEAAVLEEIKYDDTRQKRERAKRRPGKKVSGVKPDSGTLTPSDEDEEEDEPRRLTAHYGTRDQLVQRQVIRFADLIAWTHEANFFGFRDSESFSIVEDIGREYEEVAEAASRKQLAPISNVLLLRRYVAALLTRSSWPDTQWLAVAVWSMLRDYPVNERRMTAITKTILHGRRASKYNSTIRSVIKKGLDARFSHLESDVPVFGDEGFGYGYAPESEEHKVVQSALYMMLPWGVPCFASLPMDPDRETFAEVFRKALNDPDSIVSNKVGRGTNWFRRARKDAYPDDEGRRVMYRAHALLCPKCFERIAADYERAEITPSGQHSKTRAEGAYFRLPKFFLPSTAEEEVTK